MGSLKKVNNLFIKDIFHGYCLKRQSLKKKTLYNRYYETFAEFKAACEEFFRNPSKYQRELRSLLTNNFELIG